MAAAAMPMIDEGGKLPGVSFTEAELPFCSSFSVLAVTSPEAMDPSKTVPHCPVRLFSEAAVDLSTLVMLPSCMERSTEDANSWAWPASEASMVTLAWSASASRLRRKAAAVRPHGLMTTTLTASTLTPASRATARARNASSAAVELTPWHLTPWTTSLIFTAATPGVGAGTEVANAVGEADGSELLDGVLDAEAEGGIVADGDKVGVCVGKADALLLGQADGTADALLLGQGDGTADADALLLGQGDGTADADALLLGQGDGTADADALLLELNGDAKADAVALLLGQADGEADAVALLLELKGDAGADAVALLLGQADGEADAVALLLELKGVKLEDGDSCGVGEIVLVGLGVVVGAARETASNTAKSNPSSAK